MGLASARDLCLMADGFLRILSFEKLSPQLSFTGEADRIDPIALAPRRSRRVHMFHGAQ